jgi:formate hydrogenlyase subunit 6/NADH:ubiquinone oxidoreductase subunit I
LFFEIDAAKCKGCSLCARACAVDTIRRVPGQKKFYIEQEKCVHCGACFDACRFDAVIKSSPGRIRMPKPEEALAIGETP